MSTESTHALFVLVFVFANPPFYHGIQPVVRGDLLSRDVGAWHAECAAAAMSTVESFHILHNPRSSVFAASVLWKSIVWSSFRGY